MATATVAEITTTRKPAPKAFYATVYDVHGTLVKLDGIIYFMTSESGDIAEYEPEQAPWTCILGEIGLSETQPLMDTLHGGAAWIATHRAQEMA